MNKLNKIWPLGLNRRNWPIGAALLVVVLALVSTFDVAASQQAMRWPDQAQQIFNWITDFGLSDRVLIPSLIILVLARLAMLVLPYMKRLLAYEVFLYASFIFVGVGLPGLASNLCKRIIGRGRPVLFDEVGAFDFQHVVNDWTHQSFPSGHTTTALALALVISFLWPKLFWPFLLFGLAIGFSRVPVGAHYPTDVVGGIALGTLGAYWVRNFFAGHGWLFRKRPDGTVRRRPLIAWRRLIGGRQRNDLGRRSSPL